MAAKVSMTEVEAELVEIADIHRKKGESTKRWARRLVAAYGKLSDEEVEALSEDTFAWCEAAMKAKNEKQELPPFDMDDEEEAAEDEEEAEEEEQDDDEDEEAAEDEDEDEEEAEEDEEEAEEDEEEAEEDDEDEDDEDEEEEDEKPAPRRKVKSKSGKAVDQTQALRELVITNWGLERKQLLELADEAGIELSFGSVNGVLYHTRQTLNMLESVLGIKVPRVKGAEKKKKTKTARKPAKKATRKKATRKSKTTASRRKRAK